MHVLVLPSFYPTLEDPNYGCFFFEQTKLLQEAGVQLGVIHPEVRPLKAFSWPLLKKNYFQISEMDRTFRLHGWNLFPGFLPGTKSLFVKGAEKLFKRYIKKFGMPDLIHAHCTVWGGVAAHHLSEIYGIPFIITEHRSEFLKPDLMEKRIYLSWLKKEIYKTTRQAEACVAVSFALKKALESLSSANIQVIPNFLDLECYPLPSKKSDPFTYFSLSNLIPRKNIQLLIKAFELIHKKSREVRLIIGGDGPEKKKLEQMVYEKGLQKEISFLGKLSRSQVKEAMAYSHVFVLPSLAETFGIVFIEALAMGLPVIGTRCGGPEDIITDKVGKLVACNDLNALAEAMWDIKKNSFDPQHLRNYVQENFSKEKVLKQYLELYTNNLKN